MNPEVVNVLSNLYSVRDTVEKLVEKNVDLSAKVSSLQSTNQRLRTVNDTLRNNQPMWKLCIDEHPAYNERVLGCDKHGDIIICYCAENKELKRTVWYNSDSFEVFPCVYWMKLPTMPTVNVRTSVEAKVKLC